MKKLNCKSFSEIALLPYLSACLQVTKNYKELIM
jgi:hypothetical protein